MHKDSIQLADGDMLRIGDYELIVAILGNGYSRPHFFKQIPGKMTPCFLVLVRTAV